MAKKAYGRSTRVETVGQIADKLLEWVRADDERVWVKDFFSTELSIPMDEVAEVWINKSARFKSNMTLCRDIIEGRLLRMSMDKKNRAAAGAIFALKNQFDWMDKRDIKKNVKHEYRLTKDDIAEKAKKFFPKPDGK